MEKTYRLDEVGLHDCMTRYITYEKGVLSFSFPDGFYILDEDSEPERCVSGTMNCFIKDEEIDGMSFCIYRKDIFGREIRDDVSSTFIRDICRGEFIFEFVTTYTSYERVLFKGYIWKDKKPYHQECEIELHVSDITFTV